MGRLEISNLVVKKQIKNLEEQNDLAVNNMPENDEDFIEYDLDLKEKMQF